MSDIAYDGPANLVTSDGSPFATCNLVAQTNDDGWAGVISEIQFRTQMVPFPLNAEEWLRIDGVEGAPVLKVAVSDEADESAKVAAEGNPFS